MQVKKPKIKNRRGKSKHEQEEIILFLDIRSSSIGGAFVEIFEHRKPKIIYTTRIFKYFDELQNSNSFVGEMLIVLDEILNDLQSSGLKSVIETINHKDINEAFILYASPWYVSQTKDISINKEKSFIFTKTFFEDLIKHESQTVAPNKEVSIVEKDITHVTINGYSVENPFGKKTNSVDLSFFISEMSKKTIKDIENRVKNNFAVKNFVHHTHPLALFSVLRNRFMNTPNFIFLDIGGEITDIGIVSNDMLIKNISVPYGKNYFIRSISQQCKLDSTSTDSIMKMIADEVIDDKCSVNVKKIIENLKKDWLNVVVDALAGHVAFEELPHRVFVTSDPGVANLFLEILKSKDAKELLFVSDNKVVVSLIDRKVLEDLSDYDPQSRTDNFIELATSFVYTNTQ